MRRTLLTLAACASALAIIGAERVEAQEIESRDAVIAGHGERVPAPTLKIETRVKDKGRFGRARAIYPVAGDRVQLRVKLPKGATDVRWYVVFPDATRPYNNAHPPGSEKAYSWRGVDPIMYHRLELTHLRGELEVEPLAKGSTLFAPVRAHFKAEGHSVHPDFYRDDVGTFRFQVVARDGRTGRALRSAGIEDVDNHGISRKVLRVSVRSGEAFLGYLRSFFNVPGVFGSLTPQSNNYTGADCADALVAAHGRWRRRSARKNYNVDMLVGALKRVARGELEDGEPSEPIAWSKLKPGDFIAVKYEGASRYQHVGALEGDTDGDGVLSGKDRVLHVGPWPLKSDLLGGGAFDGSIVILRPKRGSLK